MPDQSQSSSVGIGPGEMNRDTRHLAFLDGLRGVAIIGVFLYHAYLVSFGELFNWSGPFLAFSGRGAERILFLLRYGGAGVAVFFAVSGFCIHLSHSRSKDKSFGTFFIRRFFRIYPPYLACLLVFAFIPPWGVIPTAFNSVRSVMGHAALLHNLSDRTLYRFNPSFWSIAVEVQLYALYPLLWLYAQRHGWKRVMILTGAVELAFRVAAFRWTAGATPAWFTFNPLDFCFSWSVGAALAEAYLLDRVPNVSRSTCAALGSAFFFACFWAPTDVLGFPLAALFTAALICRAINNRWTADGRAGSALGKVGVVSFSLYLVHQPILAIVPRCLPTHSPVLIFCACLACFAPIYFFAALLYRIAEKPSIELGRFVLGKLNRGKVSIVAPASA